MSKVSLKRLTKILQQCGIGIDSDGIDLTPHFSVYHVHAWDHGYDGFRGINVHEDGSYDGGTGFGGTRREFYSDMMDMMTFLFEYADKRDIKELIAAPCFRYNQFSFNAEKNDIYDEIYEFLRKNAVRKNERSGISIFIKDNRKQIEMIIEGGFRGISELCLFAQTQKVLLVPNHHFGITFFTQNVEGEKATVLSLLDKYPNLQCMDTQ